MAEPKWVYDHTPVTTNIRCHQYNMEPPPVGWPSVLEAAKAVIDSSGGDSAILYITPEGWADISTKHPQPRHEVLPDGEPGEVVVRVWLDAEGVSHG